MKLSLLTLFCVFIISIFLVACGAKETSSSPEVGNPSRGKELYNKTVLGPRAAPGCITCHSLEPGVILVGPSHAGIASRADSIVQGLSAEEYLRQSIISPDAHVKEGFFPGIMYQKYEEDLTEQEIQDLVAYMMTLK